MNRGHIVIDHYPADKPGAGFALSEKRGVRFVFPNGHTVSIVYGELVYSTDRNGDRFKHGEIHEDDHASTVEVAILDPQGEFVKFKDGEEVKGFASITEVLAILNWVSTR